LSTIQSVPISAANRREVKRFLKFATVGVAGMVTHMTLFNILAFVVHVDPRLANVIGFCTAVVQNFTLNRNWTFPESRQRHVGAQLGQFAIVSLIGLGINLAVFTLVDHLLEPFWNAVFSNPQVAHFVGNNFALASAILVVLFWNFTVNRLWTFRQHNK
jgi:putative flippase GtrA